LFITITRDAREDRKGTNMQPKFNRQKRILFFSKHKLQVMASIFITEFFALFILIGVMTSLDPQYRVASNTVKKWTTNVEEVHFLSLMMMENRQFNQALPENKTSIDLWKVAFELGTNIRLHDVRSLLGRELPGFKEYDREILIAGEGTDYTNLTMESTPPLDIVLEEREATEPEEKEEEAPPEKQEKTTGDRNVVYLYNTHNRESILTHLTNTENPNDAFHNEVNVTNVNDRISKSLKKNGIGVEVDETDVGAILNEKGLNYSKDSYRASKEVVETALNNNKDLNYVF